MWRYYISFCLWEDQVRKHHDISGTIWEALFESKNSSFWEPSEYHWQSNPDVWQPCLDRLCYETTDTSLELSPASSWPWLPYAFPWWAGEELVIMGLLTVSYTHLRAHETDSYLVCRLLLEKKKYAVFCLKKKNSFFFFFFLMIRRQPRSTHCISSAASDVYKRQLCFIYFIFID